MFDALKEIAYRMVYMEGLCPHLLQLRIVTVTGSNRGVLETRVPFLQGRRNIKTFEGSGSLIGGHNMLSLD